MEMNFKTRGTRLDKLLKKNPNLSSDIEDLKTIDNMEIYFENKGLSLVRTGYTIIWPWTNTGGCTKKCSNCIPNNTSPKNIYVMSYDHSENLKEILKNLQLKIPFIRTLDVQYID